MPCDVYTENGYFDTIARMAQAVEQGAADIVLMGIEPCCPSEKFGYIVPSGDGKDGLWLTAIYHPSALLRDVSKRPETFSDLLSIRAKARELGIM